MMRLMTQLIIFSCVAAALYAGLGQAHNAVVSAKGPALKLAFVGVDKRLYTVNADGTQLRALTPNFLAITDFRWSPDGSRILFCACQVERPNQLFGVSIPFYGIDADGKNLDEMGLTDAGGYPPSWSPDGQFVLFRIETGTEEALRTDVHVMQKDGTQKRLLIAAQAFIWALAWSPDSKYVGILEDTNDAAGSVFYIIEVESGKKVQVIQSISGFTWSPDSQQIACWNDQGSGWGPPRKMTLVNVKTGEQKIVGAEVDSKAIWSADNKYLIFESSVTLDKGKATVRTVKVLHSLDLTSGKLKIVADEDQVIDQSMNISPDGARMGFISLDSFSQKVSLSISALNDSNRTKLVGLWVDDFRNAHFLSARWSPNSNQIAYTEGSPEHLSLSVITVTTKARNTIAQVNSTQDSYDWQPVKVN